MMQLVNSKITRLLGTTNNCYTVPLIKPLTMFIVANSALHYITVFIISNYSVKCYFLFLKKIVFPYNIFKLKMYWNKSINSRYCVGKDSQAYLIQQVGIKFNTTNLDKQQLENITTMTKSLLVILYHQDIHPHIYLVIYFK